MKYELTKELETGNSIIDSEHRELFAAINRLMDACSVGNGSSDFTNRICQPLIFKTFYGILTVLAAKSA